MPNNCTFDMCLFLTLKDNSIFCTGCLPIAAKFKNRTITNTTSVTDIITFPASRCALMLLIRNVMMHIMIPVTMRPYKLRMIPRIQYTSINIMFITHFNAFYNICVRVCIL